MDYIMTIDLKKARRHVVLEVHEAPADNTSMAIMVHKEIAAYYHLINPHWSGKKCMNLASKTVANEIESYKSQRDEYIANDPRWSNPRAYFVNVINLYRKMREQNETDDHIVGYENPAKTRWSL
jgi:hypothetical protein